MPKNSGLGRGLDELLEDNAPTVRSVSAGKPLVEKKEVRPTRELGDMSSLYSKGPRSLYETPHKNKSVKANFKKK